MNDAIDFQREVARFGHTDVAYIVDVLRGAFQISTANGNEDQLLGDFIAALDECDCIEIVEDEEMLIDEG